MRMLCLLMATAIVVMGIAQPAEALPRAQLMSCKDVQVYNLGARGSTLIPVSCATEFSAAEPYIVLLIDLQNVDYETDLGTELRDPGNVAIHAESFTIKPPPGGKWGHYWVWFVLPLSATSEQLADKGLLFRTVGLKERPPISERLGEWTLTVTLPPGLPVIHKFTLRP